MKFGKSGSTGESMTESTMESDRALLPLGTPSHSVPSAICMFQLLEESKIGGQMDGDSVGHIINASFSY